MESTYTAPAVVELGTVSELTLKINVGPYHDSAIVGGQLPNQNLS